MQYQAKTSTSTGPIYIQLNKNHLRSKWKQNMGAHLSIDETSLSNGELYTIVTNKAAKGRKGALVAIVEETKANEVIQVLDKIPAPLLNQVEEVTLEIKALELLLEV